MKGLNLAVVALLRLTKEVVGIKVKPLASSHLKLAIGFGEGAELRRPLGVSIVGGLIVSQLLTLYTTPVIYLYLNRLRLSARRRWRYLHFTVNNIRLPF